MDVTNIILCRPPLTSNNLDASQRARLIRSTRKLGAILGTTPRLAEPELPVEPIRIALLPIGRTSTDSSRSSVSAASSEEGHGYGYYGSYSQPHSSSVPAKTKAKKNGMYASASASSSASSLADVLPLPKSFSTRPRHPANAPRPLVLRLNPIAVDVADVRIPVPRSPPLPPLPASHDPATPRVSLAPFTPLSPFMTTNTPPTPTTPTPTPTPTESEVRRRRMAKLARTFGENVPPEMVFHSPAPRPRQPLPPVAAYPEVICLNPPPRRSSRVWVTGSKRGTWVGEWNRRDIQEVQHKLRTLKVR